MTGHIHQAKIIINKTCYERTKRNHPKVSYYEEILDALPYVSSMIREGDLFITMGAGDNWKIGKALKALLEQLEAKRK